MAKETNVSVVKGSEGSVATKKRLSPENPSPSDTSSGSKSPNFSGVAADSDDERMLAEIEALERKEEAIKQDREVIQRDIRQHSQNAQQHAAKEQQHAAKEQQHAAKEQQHAAKEQQHARNVDLHSSNAAAALVERVKLERELFKREDAATAERLDVAFQNLKRNNPVIAKGLEPPSATQAQREENRQRQKTPSACCVTM